MPQCGAAAQSEQKDIDRIASSLRELLMYAQTNAERIERLSEAFFGPALLQAPKTDNPTKAPVAPGAVAHLSDLIETVRCQLQRQSDALSSLDGLV